MRTHQNRFRKQALVQAGGILALSTLAGAVEAVPIYSGLKNIAFSGPSAHLALDLNTDSITDVTFQANFVGGSGYSIDIIGGGVGGTGFATAFNANKQAYVTNFTQGSTIDVGATYSPFGQQLFNNTDGLSTWSSSNPNGYLGFHLGTGEYGWLYVSSIDNGANSSITLRDWAYGDVVGAAIAAGAGIPAAVPEPGTAALLLAAGVATVLKRRFARR
jgi:hypothetical protein